MKYSDIQDAYLTIYLNSESSRTTVDINLLAKTACKEYGSVYKVTGVNTSDIMTHIPVGELDKLNYYGASLQIVIDSRIDDYRILTKGIQTAYRNGAPTRNIVRQYIIGSGVSIDSYGDLSPARIIGRIADRKLTMLDYPTVHQTQYCNELINTIFPEEKNVTQERVYQLLSSMLFNRPADFFIRRYVKEKYGIEMDDLDGCARKILEMYKANHVLLLIDSDNSTATLNNITRLFGREYGSREALVAIASATDMSAQWFGRFCDNLGANNWGQLLTEYMVEKYGVSDEADIHATLLRKFEENPDVVFCDLAYEKPTLKAIRRLIMRKKVSRTSVINMAFALGMTLTEVNTFLSRYIQSYELDTNNYLESIYYYVLSCGADSGYDAASDKVCNLLLKKYYSLPPALHPQYRPLGLVTGSHDLTSEERENFFIEYLNYINTTAEQKAERLSKIITGLMDSFRKTQSEIEDKDDSATLIQIFSDGIPHNKNSGFAGASASALRELMDEYQINNQRLSEIRRRSQSAHRMDSFPNLRKWVVSLTFAELSLREYCGLPTGAGSLSDMFTARANKVLGECGYSELDDTIPYDCLLSLSIRTKDPIGTLNYINQRSYDN